MRLIHIRRHAATKKGPGRGKGSHLSAAGIATARSVGAETGPFDLVLASTVPRTQETAIAMGFAVDDQLEVLDEIPADVFAEIGHHERWSWDTPFLRFAQIIAHNGPTAHMGLRVRDCWTQALESVAQDGRVLVISHGRILETGLVSCTPHGDYPDWGIAFRHLEGFELGYEDGQFSLIRFLRVEPPDS